jgi:uncharacterized membrane protein YozB (DUF420 family)
MIATDLPALNAALNSLSALLLVWGYMLIRRQRVAMHERVMLTAFGVSVLFLVSYLVYHAQVGTVRYQGTGTLRMVYFLILGTHTVLAALVAPLALVTLIRGLRQRYDRHRRLARWTLPIWLYVNVTGVVIYWMLYRM